MKFLQITAILSLCLSATSALAVPAPAIDDSVLEKRIGGFAKHCKSIKVRSYKTGDKYVYLDTVCGPKDTTGEFSLNSALENIDGRVRWITNGNLFGSCRLTNNRTVKGSNAELEIECKKQNGKWQLNVVKLNNHIYTSGERPKYDNFVGWA